MAIPTSAPAAHAMASAPAVASALVPVPPPAPAPPPAVSFVQNAAGLVYGDTGTGKTLLLATLFLWVWQRFHLRSRYYAFDTGGYPDLMKELILAGVVEIYRPMTRDPVGSAGIATGTLAKVTRGGWPVERDPTTGDGPLNVPLVMPTYSVWVVSCSNNHECIRSTIPPNIQAAPPCPTCGGVVASVREIQELTPSFRGIGAIGYDSLTKMGDFCMDEMDRKAGEGVLGGLKGNLNTVFSDGEMWGTSGMSAVGFGQNRCFDWLANAAMIPGLVTPPYFTALVDKGTDKQLGAVMYVPKIVGSARGYQVPREVGNCLLTRKEGEAHKLYLRGVAGENGVPYVAKVRSADVSLPLCLEDPPGATLENGQLFSRFSLGHLHELLEAAAGRVKSALQIRLAGAPGLGSGVLATEERARARNAQPSAVSAGTGSGLPGFVSLPTTPTSIPTSTPTSALVSTPTSAPARLLPEPLPTAAPIAQPAQLTPARPTRVTTFPLVAPAGLALAPIVIPLPTIPTK